MDRGEGTITNFFRDIAADARDGFEGEGEAYDAAVEDQAAAKLQARTRGMLARRPALADAQNHHAANVIQSSFRHLASQRRRANRKRPGSRSRDQDSAAVVIQQRARGANERRNFALLRDRKRALVSSGQDTTTVRASEAADEAAMMLERMAMFEGQS